MMTLITIVIGLVIGLVLSILLIVSSYICKKQEKELKELNDKYINLLKEGIKNTDTCTEYILGYKNLLGELLETKDSLIDSYKVLAEISKTETIEDVQKLIESFNIELKEKGSK